MRRHVFVRDNYFVQKRNTAGTLGLSCLQKVVMAFQIIAYGVAADAMNEYMLVRVLL
jgi:hypothetical protein